MAESDIVSDQSGGSAPADAHVGQVFYKGANGVLQGDDALLWDPIEKKLSVKVGAFSMLTFDNAGSLGIGKIRRVSTNYAAVPDNEDTVILVDASEGNVQIEIGPIMPRRALFIRRIDDVGANSVTLIADLDDKIEGSDDPFPISTGESVMIVPDPETNEDWWIIAKK